MEHFPTNSNKHTKIHLNPGPKVHLREDRRSRGIEVAWMVTVSEAGESDVAMKNTIFRGNLSMIVYITYLLMVHVPLVSVAIAMAAMVDVQHL